ncbi:hypothetical protein ASD83_01990 [Devosia sp. Root685]|uniref:hypothetical protein n=1 Tax=Devosia sp. Root685 TaxID=1736587 RepID=UPI0006F92C7F|nr:hypothetical protein [Devosia sp. Root685]KRA99322.1 hypothetical protein ASD83_01990 [Devosia sp. Root685]
MTTIAQVKSFSQPFLSRNPDFAMVGRKLIRLPIGHVITGFNLQRTSLVTHIRTTWFSGPMFTPPFCSAGMGSENGIMSGDIDDPLYPSKFLSELERTNSDLLDKIGTIQGILDHPHEPFYTFGIRPEAEAVLLTGLGRFSQARASLEELFASERRASDAHRREIEQMQRDGRKVWVWANVAGGWHEKRVAHLKELLAVLTHGAPGPISALLHQWEAIKAKELKLEKLWTPTPFAFEN